MSWKSTQEISRIKLEEMIKKEIYIIENLNDKTLCYILEILGEDKNTEIYEGYNYIIGN